MSAVDDRTVMLARARAQAAGCLGACEAAFGRAKNESEAAQVTATIEPLTRAVAALSQAVAASVGHGAKTPAAPDRKAL